MEQVWHQFYDPQVPPHLSYPSCNLYQLFDETVKSNPDGTATLFFGARLSWRALARRVENFASALHELGVRKGDRVALILPNFPLYPIAHFAVLRLGAVLVPTNPLYVERELEYQLNNAEVETVVLLDQLYPRLAAVKSKTPVRRVILGRIRDFLPTGLAFLYGLKHGKGVEPDPDRGVYAYSELNTKSPGTPPPAQGSPDEIAILLYTGGTTGISKGAMLSHRNLVCNAHQTRAWLWSMTDGQEILLCVLPFFHSYGMTTGLHLAVLSRSTMLLLPRFEVKDVVKQIRKYRPTVFCGVPSMYNAINRYPGIGPADVGSIRLCVSGGAALPEEVQRRFEELTGGKLVEGYGLSETSPVAIVNPTHGHRKIGTIGVPISDTEAMVVDPENGNPLPPGEIGELAIRGPQVMQGYWKMPEETEKVLRNGWLYTGDMAVMDEEGFFRIVDRKKDIIISAGMNVYPREVEEVLHQHPKIVEAAVVGVPSRVREEVVKAFVVVREGESITKQEIVEFCRDKLARYKIPREVEVVDELPKSAVGKVLKRVLKEEQARKQETA